MNKYNLSEGSKSYHQEAYIYERFSEVEDTPQRVRKFLEPFIKDKNVLDVGCGTGKYLKDFAPLANKYYGLDISEDQLKIAREKVSELSNVRFICSSAENIQLPPESIDVIISTWVLGTILETGRRKEAVYQMQQVLKPNGQIYLVENDIGGEFEFIRGRYPDISRTQEYNEWLESAGFRTVEKINTYFEFDSLEEAKDIFSPIWGENVKENIKSKRIEHSVVIYKK